MQIYVSTLNIRLLTKMLTDYKSKFYRHMHIGMSGMIKLWCVRWIEFIVFCVKFLSSPDFPGLGFGTVLLYFRIGCQGFTEPNLFTLLNKNQTPFVWKEYLICGSKGNKDFQKSKIYLLWDFNKYLRGFVRWPSNRFSRRSYLQGSFIFYCYILYNWSLKKGWHL